MKPRTHLMIALAVMLVAVGYYLLREQAAAGGFGFPLERAWLHAQLARNLVLGNGFGITPGTTVSASTGPLWTLLAATGYLISGDPVFASKVAGVLLIGVSVFFVYNLVRAISNDRREALFAAVVTASLPKLTWAGMAGVESSLAVALVLGGVVAHVLYNRPRDRRQYLSTVLFALAAMARPECAIFFVVAMIDRVLADTLIRWRELAGWEWLVPVLVHVALFVGVLAPLLYFNERNGLGLFPNTLYAHVFRSRSGLLAAVALRDWGEFLRSLTVRPFDYAVSLLSVSLRDNPPLFILGSFGFLRLIFSDPYGPGARYRSFIVPLSVVVFPLAMGAFAPFARPEAEGGTYVASVAPFVLVLGTVGLYGAAKYAAGIFGEARRMGRPAEMVIERGLVWLFMLLALAAQARSLWYSGRIYGREVAVVERTEVALGKWIDMNLPQDALLAVDGGGAIAYFSNRPVLDTSGAASPEMLRAIRRGEPFEATVFRVLRAVEPDYAVFRPDRYPDVVAKSPLFDEIMRAGAGTGLASGFRELAIYRLEWELYDEPESGARGSEGHRDGGPSGGHVRSLEPPAPADSSSVREGM